MKERPILFSSPMVRAILDGSKTMTRRVINPQPIFVSGGWHWGDQHFYTDEERAKRLLLKAGIAPKAGEMRWVKETWQPHPEIQIKGPGGVIYRADRGGDLQYPDGKWKPSIFMPRWASRITLEITAVRVERLQNITEEDAKAEGVEKHHDLHGRWKDYRGDSSFESPKSSFFSLWDSIQLQRSKPKGAFAWSQNPWVYAISFKRLNRGSHELCTQNLQDH